MTKTKIAIGIPLFDNVQQKTIIDYNKFYNYSKQKYDLTPIFTVKNHVSTSKNFIVKKFLETECEYLLLLDQNISIPEKTIDLLLNDNKDVVATNKTNTNCVLIKRNALEKMEIPFKTEKTKKGDYIEEDENFFNKVKEAGFEIAINEKVMQK